MNRRKLARSLFATTAAMMLALPVAAQARDLYATDASGNLVRFDHQSPGQLLDSTPITGLPAGARLVGIDFRPATGGLVGVGSNGAVFNINPDTAVATQIGVGFTPGLSGSFFGVDVNPAADALRITSDAELNYRIAFATGNHGMASPDGALNPGALNVVGSAYTNNPISGGRPASTTLYAIDSNSNQLFTQVPPNAGTLTDPKPLGVDVGNDLGFDIAGNGNINDAFVATTPAGARGAALYRVSLSTGAATSLGGIGTGRLTGKGTTTLALTSLAARQNISLPLIYNVAPNVKIVRTTLAPRPNQRAGYIARGADPDGALTKIEWDTDGDGVFDDATGFGTRIPLPAGENKVSVRVTDESGARAVDTVSVRIR